LKLKGVQNRKWYMIIVLDSVKGHLMVYRSWHYGLVPSTWNRKYPNISKNVEIITPKPQYLFLFLVSISIWWYVNYDHIWWFRPFLNVQELSALISRNYILTPGSYMAEKIMCLQVDQQHILD
jgi:hypothetical protein